MSDELELIDDCNDDVLYHLRKMILMHQDVSVMDVDVVNDRVDGIGRIYNASHLPVMRRRYGTKLDRWDFVDWWESRGIPKYRFGLSDIFSNIPAEYRDCNVLQTLNLGLSLSDQYWLKPFGSSITWTDVNYFENCFGNQLSDWCVDDKKVLLPEDVCLIGPSSSLGGNQKKAWKIVDGKRVMLKASSQPYRQEAVNEVIGSRVCNILGVSHIRYDILRHDGVLYSACECGISKDEDMVSLYDLSNMIDLYNGIDVVDKCRDFLVNRGIDAKLDDMIIVDYILRNSDRHLRNVAVIKSAKTNEFLRMFPVFDFGNSLWHDVDVCEIDNKPLVNKLTGRMYEDDLRCVDNLSFGKDKLFLIPDIVKTTMKEFGCKRDRILAITDCVEQRVDHAVMCLENFYKERYNGTNWDRQY